MLLGIRHRVMGLTTAGPQLLHMVDHLRVAQAQLVDEPGTHHRSGPALTSPAVQQYHLAGIQLRADMGEDRVVAGVVDGLGVGIGNRR